MFSMVSDNYCS